MLLLIFEKTGINIGLWIITPLFKLAAFAFKIFMILAQSDVLKEIDYGLLLTNFYVILGLIMLFIMAFALLRGIVNPDDQKQGTTVVKNVIINFVISCIMLGFLPTIFPFMFDVQDSILRYNVIGGFFGYSYTGGKELTQTDNVNEVEASAYRLVNGVFTAFFNVSDGYCTNFLSGGTDNSGDSEKTFKGKREELEACQESLSADVDLIESGNGDSVADNFLEYKDYVDRTGQFGVYSNFVDQAAEGNIDFDFLVLLIAGIALLYVGTSYCFDMGLRLIKLIFYQLIAPIPIFLRVVPNSKFSGTFNQWLKVTLTCWMEVFVRIFIFCFCTWLCSAILDTPFISTTVYNFGRTTGLVTTAFILMAVVMFMKRSPKLISEITGIDSGNMKLGIREKLADGGAFVAGAAIGGGITALGRNAVTGVKGVKNKFTKDENGKIHLKEGESKWSVVKGVAGGVLGSAIAGGASGLIHSGASARGKKTFKDTGSAIQTGATKAVEKGTKRRNYVAKRGGTINAIKGRITDAGMSVGSYFGIGANEATMGLYTSAAQTSDSINSISEGTYKNKKEYQDQSSVVKRLGAEYNEGISVREKQVEDLRAKMEEANNKGDIASAVHYSEQMAQANRELNEFKTNSNIKLEFDKQTHVLEELRKDLSKSKTDILATAATRIGVDQKTNYVNNKELSDSFKKAIVDAFKGSIDINTGQINGISEENLKIVNAMLSGQAIDKDWINRDNLIFVQDAIDNINVGRQNAKGEKEREFIVASGNKQLGDKK